MTEVLKENWPWFVMALVVLLALYTAVFLAYVLRRKMTYDTDQHRIELEMLRRSIEGQIYSLSEKLVATDSRWRDVNHLLISSQNGQRPDIPDKSPLSAAPLLEAAGINAADIPVDPNLVFVLTPFHPKYEQQFEVISAVCREFQYKVLRGDEEYVEGDVFRHILKLIARARLIVANIDGRNPNVLYELGIAHGFGKPSILIARVPGEVPFDVRAKRLVLYENLGDLRNKLRDELARAITSSRPGLNPSIPEAEGVRGTPEYIGLRAAARKLYEVARQEGALLATAAERMSGDNDGRITVGSPNDVLDFAANHIARHIPIYGKRAPSTVLERIPIEEVRRSRFTDGANILRDVTYDKSIYWTDLAVRSSDFDTRFDEMKALATPRQELEAEAGFLRGFDPKSKDAKDAQLLLLAHLRDEGVRIRNGIPEFMTDDQLATWDNKLLEWMNAVREALKPISAADSKWFATLDTVPPARVPVPHVRLSGKRERALYETSFRQHDYRLARLDGLLQKYGVGAKP
jgi:hypothetical protein